MEKQHYIDAPDRILVKESSKINVPTMAEWKNYIHIQLHGSLSIPCSICNDNIPIQQAPDHHIDFAMCDQCKSDLKEFVLSKRETKND